MSECPSENEILAGLDGRLSPEQAERQQEHIDGCPECFALFGALAQTGAQASKQPAWVPPPSFSGYRVVQPLGHGNMGQVYLGHDIRLERPVAIKFIASHKPDDEDRERFLIEARAIARLQHPNVLAIHRVGEVEGWPYLVSELIPGQSLDKLDKPIPWVRALSIGLGLSLGLAAAHRRGVLHRDIKPANVMLTDEGEVKLLDFGLAKLIGQGDAWPEKGTPATAGMVRAVTVTSPGAIIGTPLYMSPEVWRREGASHATDIYSLGALLYDLCAGHPPHSARTVTELSARVQGTDAPPLSERVPHIDRRFAAIVDRCLRRDPAARFASATELHEALTVLAAPAPQRRPAWQRPLLAVGAAATLAAVALGTWRLHGEPPVPPPGMAYLPAGSFQMGSSDTEIDDAYRWCQRLSDRQVSNACSRKFFEREQPAHTVRLSPFFLDITEVNNDHFAAWLNRHPEYRVIKTRVWDQNTLLADLSQQDGGRGGLAYQDGRYGARPGFEHRPVTQVTWTAAAAFCRDQGKSLPTEAQYEYAARGAQGYRFPWGNEEPECEGVAFDRRGECTNLISGPVALQDRSPQGVLNLAGNVSEWVLDRFTDRYPPCQSGCQDPVVGGEGREALRGVRGCDWANLAVLCRAAARSRLREYEVGTNIGFRCAQRISR